MERKHQPLDEWKMRYATSAALERAKRYEDYQTDARREKRERQIVCKSCFYLSGGRIGGSAMTRWWCGICASKQIAGSTATGEVCLSCAKTHNLCTRCGGDLEMRERRRKWPTPEPQREDSA
jgi:hypothetical protein